MRGKIITWGDGPEIDRALEQAYLPALAEFRSVERRLCRLCRVSNAVAATSLP